MGRPAARGPTTTIGEVQVPAVRRLEGPELVAYDVIDPLLARRVRVVKVPLLAPGAAGMTVGTWVFVRRDDDRSGRRELLAHELVHVGQYADLGVVGFLSRYLVDYLGRLVRLRNHRDAYLAIPAEVEARSEAKAWTQRRA